MTESNEIPTDAPPLDEPTLAPRSNHSDKVSERASLPAVGTVVDDCEILGEIARGGMGVVFRARHQQLDRHVALKMVLETDGNDKEVHQRFANEARAAAAVEHPGIVPVFDVGTWNGHPYFTMAFVDGESLHALLRDGPLPAKRATEIAKEVAEAISHAHEQKVIHRDLKPANILLDKNGAAHVTDFGVSKFLEGGSNLTSTGELVGTPHYMPPEQAGGKNQSAGPTSDVYSIGAVLYASLTGRPPFQAATPIDVVTQVLTREAVPPSALVGGLPVELDVITLKCLQKNPKDRYLSADDLADDLDRYLSGEPIAARPPSLWQRGQLLVRRHIMLASVSGTVALLLLGLSLLVSVLYLQARGTIDSLNEELDLTKQLAVMDQATTKRFLNSKESTDNSQYARFQTLRLAGIALELRESNPDVALQLSIESTKLALDAGIEPNPELAELIRTRIASKNDKQEIEPSPGSDLKKLLADAKELIEKPLTTRQRVLFGLIEKPDDSLDESQNDEQSSDNKAGE